MNLLVDALIGFVAGWLTIWIANLLTVPHPINIVLGIIVGIVVFLSHPSARIRA